MSDHAARRPVVVTGGAGTIGTAALAELVGRGLGAVSYDIAPPTVAGSAHVLGDVRELDHLVEVLRDHHPGAVVHLAAMVGVDTDADPHTATTVNVLGTSNVLEACRLAGVRRVVLASSIMRQAGRGLPHTGGDFPAPRNLYGAHKLVAELEAEAFRAVHGLEPVAVAIAGTLGAGRRPASPSRAPHLHLLQQVAASRPARLEADERWQLPLRRAAQLAVLLVGAATAPRCRPFYQAGGRPTTLGELVAAVRRCEPTADVELVGGSWSALEPVDAGPAEADFGLVEESLDQMVSATLAELRGELNPDRGWPAPGA